MEMFSMLRGYMEKKKLYKDNNHVDNLENNKIITPNIINSDKNKIMKPNIIVMKDGNKNIGESKSMKKESKNMKKVNNNNPRRNDDKEKRVIKDSSKDYSNGREKSVKEKETSPKHDVEQSSSAESVVLQSVEGQPESSVKARSFTYAELVTATKNFKEKNFLGQGGFGRVYKGYLEDTNEVVAIKQLDIHGCQGVREFVVEVMTLSMADHPNLVRLIGYCVEGEQRLLVYEYMPLGSLEDHLFGEPRKRRQLDWTSRMKIAAGAAKGLEYLHGEMKPPVIYRDVKCSNILLGEGYHSKLSDFGLAKVGPSGDKTHVSTRVMGTYGYCAPDYALTGQLTFKSDIYSFGVVLLEIITGRAAIDHTRPPQERNLVDWARPLFKDRKNFVQMADPSLKDRYPARALYQTLAICAMCLQEQPNRRPAISDIVHALTFLASKTTKEQRSPTQNSVLSPSSHVSSPSSHVSSPSSHILSPSSQISESNDETNS